LPRGLDVVIPRDSDDAFAARDFRDVLRIDGVPLATGTGSAKVVLLRASAPAAKALMTREHLAFDPAMHDEGYLLVPDGLTLTVIGETAEGVFYPGEDHRR
jgi:hexosaminidase